jgi:negative regulator of sigma E activity
MSQAPKAADHRRIAQIRDRWHTALTGLAVAALVVLVFWLLPLPARAAGQACDSAMVKAGNPTAAPAPGPMEARSHGGRERVFR